MTKQKWARFEEPQGWDKDAPYDIRERTFLFTAEVIHAIKGMSDNPAARVVTYQLIKAATSVGANVEEADGAESKRDFAHKMSIARKEARESRYWVRIIQASIEKSDKWAIIQQESEEIARILSAIIHNARKNQPR